MVKIRGVPFLCSIPPKNDVLRLLELVVELLFFFFGLKRKPLHCSFSNLSLVWFLGEKVKKLSEKGVQDGLRRRRKGEEHAPF